MNEIHEGHAQLVVILDDQIEQGKHIDFDGVALIRQHTDAPLYAISIDDDIVSIFRADHAPSTTALARQLRQTAAAYRQGDGSDAEAAADAIADGGGHSLH